MNSGKCFRRLACLASVIPVAATATPPQLSWTKVYGAANALGTPSSRETRAFMAADGGLVTTAYLGESYTTGRLCVWKHSPAGSEVWSFADSSLDTRGFGGSDMDAQGNIYIAGWTNADLVVLKLSAAGTKIWRKTYDGGTGVPEQAAAAVADGAGGVYIAGRSGAGSSADILLLKYDSAGNVVWVRTRDGTAHNEDAALAMVRIPDGGVAVSGSTNSFSANFLARWDANGTELWTRQLALGGSGNAACLVRDSSGNLYTGGSVPGPRGSLGAVVKYSPAGDLVWSTMESDSADSGIDLFDSAARLIALDPDGRLGAVTHSMSHLRGSASGWMGSGSLVIFSPAGDELSKTGIYSRSTNSSAMQFFAGGVTHWPRGGFVVGGEFADGFLSVPRRTLVAVRTDGTVDWKAGSDADPFFDGSLVSSVVVGPDAHLYAAAGSSDSGRPRVVMEKWLSGPPEGPPQPLTSGADTVTINFARAYGAINPSNLETTWYFQYGPSAAYGSQSPGGTVQGGFDVPVSAMLTGLTKGTLYHFRLVGTNSAGTSYGVDQTFTTPTTPYDAWKLVKFGGTATPGSGPGDDPDNDGINNVIEYGFGGDPLVADAPPGMPRAEWYVEPGSGAKRLSILYTINPLAADLQYHPEAGTDFSNFSTGQVTVLNLPGDVRRAVAGGSSRLMRVRVTLLTQ